MAGFGSSWLPMMTDPYAVQAQTAQNPATQLPPGWMATPEAQAIADAELRKKQGPMGPPQPPPKPKMVPTPPPQPSRQLQGPDPSTTDITARSDYDELVARLNAKGLDSLQQQQGGLDDLRQKIALQLEHSSPQLDLTPLLALTDTWSGSNLAQSYQRPGFEKNQETIRQLEGALRQGQAAMSDNEISLLKGQLGIEDAKLAREERAQERAYQREQDKLNAALRRSEIAANKANAQAIAHGNKVEADVQKLGDKLEPLQNAGASIDDLETELGFKLEDYDPAKHDLPGVSVPGIGRVSAYSGDARQLQSKVGTIFNTVLKDRSGATVTNTELDRLRSEFGAGKFNTEPELIKALQDYKAAAARAMNNTTARFTKEAVGTYQARGGRTSIGGEAPAIDDNAAVEWAKANPNDPRAAQILQMNGVK